jgi:hypothetical protein
MYTNIETPTGVSAIQDFIETNKEKLPSDFPTNLFLEILNTVMENNIFTFAGTQWLQLSGTAHYGAFTPVFQHFLIYASQSYTGAYVRQSDVVSFSINPPKSTTCGKNK